MCLPFGRPRGTRTPNLRFWRPLLCQLSYWPEWRKSVQKQTLARIFPQPFILSREDSEGSLREEILRGRAAQDKCPHRFAVLPLFRLPVNRVLPIVTAELLQFQLLRHRLLVLRRRIVPAFALGALERDDFSACACHVRFLREVFGGALDEI